MKTITALSILALLLMFAMSDLCQADNRAWTRVIDYGGVDAGYDITWYEDPYGNRSVFAIGETGSGSSDAVATVKYNADDGAELWRSHEALMQAVGVEVDGSGDVYVAGQWISTGSGYIIKRDGYDGHKLWWMSPNLFIYYDDTPTPNSHAVYDDPSGDVYVYATGISYNGTSLVYSTVKIDGEDGTQLARHEYNGPDGGNDQATAVVVDDAGNVYVTGTSCLDTGSYCTAVYVRTLKYDADLNLLWVGTYSGNNVYDLAVDSSGNIFVASESGIVKYPDDCPNSGLDGCVADWTVMGASGLAVWENPVGDVYVYNTITLAGSSIGMISTASYLDEGSSAALQWEEIYDASAYYDVAADIAADREGNVWITGHTMPNSNAYDLVTIKYETEGSSSSALGQSVVRKFLDKYYSGVYGLVWASAIVVDDYGNAFVTGMNMWNGTFGEADFITIGYETTGGVNAPVSGSSASWSGSGVILSGGPTLNKAGEGTLDVVSWNSLYLEDGGEFIDPDGTGTDCPGCPLETAPRGALLGRVNDGSKAPGDPFVLGSSYSGPVAETGELELIVNDDTYGDNYGTLGTDIVFCMDCAISTRCYYDGESDPDNPCQVCDVDQSTTSWTYLGDGTTCDDGRWCTIGDQCLAGICGTVRDCADTVACTTDLCNEETDACDNLPKDGNCNNGDWCDGEETCDPVDDCQPGTPPDCGDGVTCTDDTCNETTDTCESMANNANCDNGEWCDGDETCDAALDCQIGTTVDCSGLGDQCNDGVCDDTVDQCVAQPANEDLPCDDGEFCTVGDICRGGICNYGNSNDCNDNVACTDDACDEVGDVCVNQANDANCDNGEWCDGAETCDAVDDCQPGMAPNCNDAVGCTDDSCDEIGDACVNQVNDANCDNGAWCDGTETCNAISDCQPGTAPCDPVTQTCNETDDICESVGPVYLTVTARLHGSWDGAAHTCESLVQIDLYDDTLGLVDSFFDVFFDLDGMAQVDLIAEGVAPGDYYVVLRHLNHVDLMTAAPVFWDGSSPLNVDLTNPANVECGTSTMYEWSPGVWTMPAGDIVPDHRVALSDFNYLCTHWTETNPACDLDCDGFCRLGDFNKLRQTWNTQGCAP